MFNLSGVDILFALIFWVIGFFTSLSIFKGGESRSFTVLVIISCLIRVVENCKLKGTDLNSLATKDLCKLVLDEYALVNQPSNDSEDY